MNITENEMRGLLTGKCVPGDMCVNEELPAYLVRKFAELKAQRDALAAENLTLKSAIESHKHGFVRCECCGEDNLSSNDDVCRVLDKTPATDAYLNSVRAEGIHFAANRMLAAWESGFIDDTPAQVHDISGAVLSALEFLPNASPEEFKRDYADEVRSAIANQLRAGKDGE